MSRLKVNEIFGSIQGESSFAGLPCVFVRLTGCNLRCRYCDTKYAYDEGRDMEIGEILRAVGKMGGRLVEITGGEPLLQPATPDLAACLLEAGYKVLAETNGSLPIEALPKGVVRIVDVKCPGSGESRKVRWKNLKLLGPEDEVKFVIGSREDYEWARGVVRQFRLEDRSWPLFSPVHGKLPPSNLAEWILADGLRVRLQLQLHKYIWGADRQGV
ncbi:MAG: radical SAM protein [Planctomycetota bacterium]|nr:radical SAM protein [Planctomycetota bacterium]